MPFILKMAIHSPSFGELTVQRSSAVVNAGLRAVSVNGHLLVSLLRIMAGWLEGRNAQRFVETNGKRLWKSASKSWPFIKHSEGNCATRCVWGADQMCGTISLIHTPPVCGRIICCMDEAKRLVCLVHWQVKDRVSMI